MWTAARTVISLAWLLVCASPCGAQDFSRIHESVFLVMRQRSQGATFGTAFAVSSNPPLLVTAEHLVGAGDNLYVLKAWSQWGAFHEPCLVDVERRDSKRDLALLRPRCELSVRPLRLAESARLGEVLSAVSAGSGVVSAGESPEKQSFLVTRGIVAGRKRLHGKSFDHLLADAQVYVGVSGAPLLNEAGEVLGVVLGWQAAETPDRTEMLCFAAPASELAKLLKGK